MSSSNTNIRGDKLFDSDANIVLGIIERHSPIAQYVWLKHSQEAGVDMQHFVLTVNLLESVRIVAYSENRRMYYLFTEERANL